MAQRNWLVTETLPERTSRNIVNFQRFLWFFRTRKFTPHSPLRRSILQFRQKLSPDPLCRSSNTSDRSIKAKRKTQEPEEIICYPSWLKQVVFFIHSWIYIPPMCETVRVARAALKRWDCPVGLSRDTGFLKGNAHSNLINVISATKGELGIFF